MCDRDPRFKAQIFQEVFRLLGTKLSFSTGNHPQTDGQTERMNRLIADILRCFVNHKQDNWAALLPICEYAIKNSQQASTGNSPFFLNYGFNPKVPADFILGTGARRTRPDWIQARSDALEKAQDSIVAAQARQALYADRGRNPSRLKVGDLALVYRDFLISPEARQQPSRKLQPKWFGPFRVVREVGSNAYELELPSVFRCHPVYNVTALRHYEQNTISNRRQPVPPPFMDLDGNTRNYGGGHPEAQR